MAKSPKKSPVTAETQLSVTAGEVELTECVGVRHYPAGTPMAEIRVGVGGTIPNGDYSNVRVYVEVSRPVPDSDEMILTEYQELQQRVTEFVADLIDETSPLWGKK